VRGSSQSSSLAATSSAHSEYTPGMKAATGRLGLAAGKRVTRPQSDSPASEPHAWVQQTFLGSRFDFAAVMSSSKYAQGNAGQTSMLEVYQVLHGAIMIEGKQPDGNSIRLRPDQPDLLLKLKRASRIEPSKKTARCNGDPMELTRPNCTTRPWRNHSARNSGSRCCSGSESRAPSGALRSWSESCDEPIPTS
jgi:hypothetical protein